MNTIEKPARAALEAAALVALIREQCATEVADIRAQAQERAERISAAAAVEAAALRTAAQNEGAQRGRRQAARRLAIAEAEAHRQWLVEREAIINEAITRARTQLERFAQLPGASDMLVSLIREGLQVLPAGAVRVCIPPGYEPLLDDTVRRRLGGEGWTLQFESGMVPGGAVILETADARLRFDNSFAARIRLREGRLRRLAADVLFAEEQTTE
jgi:vacuolar-type H+-ATPase subunit E/Vma4